MAPRRDVLLLELERQRAAQLHAELLCVERLARSASRAVALAAERPEGWTLGPAYEQRARLAIAIASAAAAVVHARVAALRARLSGADAPGDGRPIRSRAVDEGVHIACIHDALELADPLERGIAAADGLAAAGETVEALRELARVRALVELLAESLAPAHGDDHVVVATLRAIADELPYADAPDAAWRAQLAAERERVLALLAAMRATYDRAQLARAG